MRRGSGARLRVAALATAALALGGAGPGGSQTSTASGRTVPFETGDPRVRELWTRGYALERAGRFEQSSRLYEQVVALQPDVAHPYWRIARNHLRAGDRLPLADEDRRRREFEQVQRWAARGAEVDGRCAECFLYEFIGLSSVTRLEGTLSSARSAARMRDLLERALELRPSWVDDPRNVELANLYFAAGIFYKVVPDSALAQWALGVRGDRARSREYYRMAVELCDTRIDYLISLGSALLCEGTRHDDPARAAEGLGLLERIRGLDDYLDTDAIDREHAEILIADPRKACEYSRDAWRRAEGR